MRMIHLDGGRYAEIFEFHDRVRIDTYNKRDEHISRATIEAKTGFIKIEKL